MINDPGYRAIADSAADAIVTVRDDGAIVAWNPAAARMFGYTATEAIGRPVSILMPDVAVPEHDGGMRRLDPRSDHHLAGSVVTDSGRRRDGSTFPIELAFSEWHTPDAHYATAIIRDLASRQEEDRALRESEARFRLLTETMEDVVWTLDTETMRFLYVSPSVERLRGFTPEEVLAEPMDAALTPDQAATLKESMRLRVSALLASGQSQSKHYVDEVEQPCKDGTTVWTEVVHAYHVNAQTGGVEIHAVTRNITERRRAEAARRESEERFQAVVDEIQNPIVILRPVRDEHGALVDETVEWANRSWRSIFGGSGLPRGHRLLEVSPGALARIAFHDRVFAGKEVLRKEMGLPDGRWFDVDYLPFGDGMLVVSHDITERKVSADALRRSDEQHRAILATAQDGFWLVDLQGRLLDVNDAYARMSGYSRDELLALGIPELESIETGDATAAHITKVLADGRDRFESRHRRKDGSTFDVEVSVQFSPLDGGRIVTFVQDITERKVAEALLLSVMKAVDSTSEAVGISDAQGHHFYQNQALSDLFEYPTAEDLEAAGGGSAVVRDPDIARVMFEAIMGGGSWTGELDLVTRSGRVFAAHERADAIKDADGRVVGLVGIISDVTERRAAEEEARQMAIVLDAAPNSITVHDFDGRFLYANPKTFELHGYTRDEYMELTLRDLDVPADAALMAERMEAIGERGGASFELEHRRKDGSILPLAVAVKRITWGGRISILSVATDLTERKRAEETTAALEAQLQQAQKMESVGRLAGGVAHDFNNMLAAILGNAELALGQVEPGHPIHADLLEIQRAARRSADLTSQLLAFARKTTVAPVVVDLNETVPGLLPMLRRLIGEDVELGWQPGTDLWPILMDPSQVDQTLVNLCLNARDAIADVGTITIDTANLSVDEAFCANHADAIVGDYVRLRVSDTGHGMEPAVLDHIFEPFYTTKAVGEGTGLGLAMVYGSVRQNGGFVSVSSVPGRGSVFEIHLPRHAGAVTTAPGATAAPGAARVTPAPRREGTILVVEDEPAILRLATRVLETHGYNVLAAGSPVEALRLVDEAAAPIDLLLTDVVMPEMNGRDLANRVTALQPDLVCLFMSGHPADVIAAGGPVDAGLWFIQKPFSVHDLAAKVGRALGRDPSSSTAPAD